MLKLRDWLAPQKRLLQQEREIKQLREQLLLLESQNTSMRDGMRRCLSCEYRNDYKARLGGASDASQ